ncbi:hypothetical protein FDF26_13685 [Clostridium botulinum]|nr:hypothetical protein [Clostridium botulinum]
MLKRLLTKNLTRIPLFWVNFNYKHFKENGKLGSCNANVHPILADDKIIKQKVNELITYIRVNYDMKEL